MCTWHYCAHIHCTCDLFIVHMHLVHITKIRLCVWTFLNKYKNKNRKNSIIVQFHIDFHQKWSASFDTFSVTRSTFNYMNRRRFKIFNAKRSPSYITPYFQYRGLFLYDFMWIWNFSREKSPPHIWCFQSKFIII